MPLAAVVGWVVAHLAPAYHPPALSLGAAIPPEARQLVARQVRGLAGWHAGTLAPLGALTFLWLASGGIHTFFDALEVSTGRTRPWWKKRALSVGLTLTTSWLFSIALLLGAELNFVLDDLRRKRAGDHATRGGEKDRM